MKNIIIKSFEEFNKILKRENININEIYSLFVEKTILTSFGFINSIYKFKFKKNNSELIYSSHFSQNEAQRYDEQEEKLINERKKELSSLLDSKTDNSDTNNINIPSQNDNDSNNDDNYIPLELLIGKNLLCLCKKENKLIIICSFNGKNDNNNYYYLEAKLLLKYEHLDLNIFKKEINEINKYVSLKNYLFQKLFADKNMNLNENNFIIQLYKKNIDTLSYSLTSKDNFISNKIDIKNHINNDIKKDLQKKKDSNNIIVEQEMKKNSEEINLITQIREEKIKNINNKRKEMDCQKETTFGEDSLKSRTINAQNKSENNQEEPFNVISLFEISGVFKALNKYNIPDFVKFFEVFFGFVGFIIICILIIMFLKFLWNKLQKM